jgi:hypothetical protein
MDTQIILSRFVLIGGAQNCFDDQGCLKGKYTFQYLLIRENAKPLQMLLMIVYDPFTYQAQGLLSHMKDQKLPNIRVCGGGYITFSDNMKDIVVFGGSKSFKNAVPHAIHKFFLALYPSAQIHTIEMNPVTMLEIRTHHRVYKQEEIQLMVDELEK